MERRLGLDKTDVETLENLSGTSDLKNCDKALFTNGVIQFTSLIILIIVYLIFRRKAPWVYYSNIKNRPSHPCYQENVGPLSWINPLITTKDTELLAIVGLDGFMLLQTIKLLYRICFFAAIISSPILIAIIYKNYSKDVDFFARTTIYEIRDRDFYYGILFTSLFISIMVFYLVYIYYKRFVTLRQVYLASPAGMTSIILLKALSDDLGSNQNSVDYVNIASRTVMVDRLPNEIKNDEELKSYIESLVGEIESVSLIHDTHYIRKLYEQRDEIIQNMEKELAAGFEAMKIHYKTNADDKVKETFGDLYSTSLEESATNIFGGLQFKTPEKIKIFNKLLNNGHKFLSKTWSNKIIMGIYLDELKAINKKIIDEKHRLESTEASDPIPEASETLYLDSDVRRDVSFFSFKQIFNLKQNRDLFTVDLPLNTKRGFVTLKDSKSAGILKQAILGTRALSSNVTAAPAPYDVLWKNLSKTEVRSFFSNLVSILLFIFLNVGFLYMVIGIINSLRVENNSDNAMFKIPFVNSGYVVGLYQGILAPLVYNILLYFVPIFIKTLIHMEGTLSYSAVQSKMLLRFSLFLFFNAFLATFALSALCTLFDTNKNNLESITIVSKIGDSIVRSSVFFINLIIQRMCVGNAIVFLKPSLFLYNFIAAPVIIKTRRQSIERTFSPCLDFGNHIPNLLMVIPMALVYSCVSPIILLASFLFFFFSYFVYKNELLFATRNNYESGGSHFKPVIRFILLSLIVSQLSNLLVTFSYSSIWICLGFIPMIVISVYISYVIDDIFSKSCENFPINKPEEKFLDNFSKKVMKERFELLENWKEVVEEQDQDTLAITELGFHDSNFNNRLSFYKDPCLISSIGNFIFPKNFFCIVSFVLSFDKNNEFKLK